MSITISQYYILFKIHPMKNLLQSMNFHIDVLSFHHPFIFKIKYLILM